MFFSTFWPNLTFFSLHLHPSIGDLHPVHGEKDNISHFNFASTLSMETFTHPSKKSWPDIWRANRFLAGRNCLITQGPSQGYRGLARPLYAIVHASEPPLIELWASVQVSEYNEIPPWGEAPPLPGDQTTSWLASPFVDVQDKPSNQLAVFTPLPLKPTTAQPSSSPSLAASIHNPDQNPKRKPKQKAKTQTQRKQQFIIILANK